MPLPWDRSRRLADHQGRFDPDRGGATTNGRHHVIVDAFDWQALQTYFQRLTTRCVGADWHEVATKLARYGYWEFEDYTPAPAAT